MVWCNATSLLREVGAGNRKNRLRFPLFDLGEFLNEKDPCCTGCCRNATASSALIDFFQI
jgi:hypothetical protein